MQVNNTDFYSMTTIIKNLFVLFLLFLALGSKAANRTNFRVTRITTRNGLPSNTIRAMVQDAYGFLWFGSSDGLSRYDGYNLIDFNDPAQGKKSRNIGLLYIDKVNQLLWVSSSTYSYNCYDLRAGKFLKFEGGKDQPYSKRFHSSTGEWLWDKQLGVRHAVYERGRIVLHDYTKKNGLLTSSHVTRMTEDRYGNIWVSTQNGLTRIQGNKTMTLLKGKNLEDCMATDKYIVAFCKDNQTFYVVDFKGRVIFSRRITDPTMKVGSLSNAVYWQKRCLYFTNSGTVVFNPHTGSISRPQELQVKDGTIQGDSKGYKMVANQQGELLILPPKGPAKKLLLNKGLKTTNEKKKIFSFAVGKNNMLYISSYGMGLFTYNLLSGQLEQYTAQDSDPVIYSNYIHDILVDRLGDVWLSTEAAGITHLHPIDDYSAQYFYANNKVRGDWTNNFRLVFVDKQGEVMAATKDNNVYRFSSFDGSMKFQRETKAGISHYMIDHAGREWICTRGDGLYVDGVHYGKGLSGHELPTSDLYNAVEDRYGRVWIATWGEGLLLSKWINGRLTMEKQYLMGQYNAQRIHDLELSPEGLLFVGSQNGLYVLDTNKKKITKKDFVAYNSELKNFPGNEVLCLKYAYGSLWVGIMPVGVVKCDFTKGISRMKYQVIDKHNGLADNGVLTISSDSYGAVWVGTGSSLSRIDCKENIVRNFYVSQNPLSNAFAVNGSLEMKDGRLFFGTQEGLLVVHPKKLGSMRPYVKKVSLTDLLINGLSIYNQTDSDLIGQAIQLTKKITLNHDQNSLRINFSTLDFNDEGAQLFQTKLDGVENDWRPATNSNFAIYTHLEPGSYKFHVRAWNGVEWGPETLLAIRISQPWWNTWWAWCFYLLLVGALIVYVFENTRARLRLHQQMKINEQVTEFRLNFFTHITHEFRTPLAIIQSGVSNLVDSKTQKVSKSSVQTVKRGTKRLLRLVNQLMEFRRISTNNRKLHVSEGDIIVFIRDIWQDLWSIANQKGLGYHFVPFDHHYQMLFDHEIVETVVYNLLSNALKYTGNGGNVSMKIALEKGDVDKLIVTVEDNGPGIAPENLNQLFQPFMHGYTSKGGMGIGLYTARKMAESHHGTLVYERVSDEGGSRFIFTLPDDPSVYDEEDISTDVAINVGENAERHADEIISAANIPSLNQQKVAIIEDDTDMMEQMKSMIGYYFKTVGFTNGREGYEGVLREKPSLVLCDLMLPDMDGYEIVRRIKAEPAMKYTPVIMLTALDDEQHQIKGYQAGADDYMVKPCNYHLLIARIIQLIKWSQDNAKSERAALQANDAADDKDSAGQKDNAEKILDSKADKVFHDTVQRIVAENMGNPNFNVDLIAEKMCMGRSKFYGKMRDIFGMTPNKYILNARLTRAAELIVEGRYNISEISSMVGMENQSHFTRCFKAKYNILPSKYKG